jgi:DNA-binding SARP family transcriptional activator
VRIRLTTLGGLALHRDGVEVAALGAQRLLAAILVYLAVEREATRDQLLVLFYAATPARWT